MSLIISQRNTALSKLQYSKDVFGMLAYFFRHHHSKNEVRKKTIGIVNKYHVGGFHTLSDIFKVS